MANEAISAEAAGGYGNMVLYRMCAEEPSHSERGIVLSKARIIAKVYEVSRNLGKDFDLVAKLLCSKKLALDASLRQLEGMDFSKRSLPLVIEIHSKLDRLLCAKLAKASGNRAVYSRSSFVSKYLHFHRPDNFPILDSLAERAIKERTGGRLPKAAAGLNGTSARYERFCRAVLRLKDRGDFSNHSLRGLDEILVERGRELRERDKAKRR